MKHVIPEQTAMAIRHLLQVANAENVSVAGFAFGIDAGITNFGNTSDCTEIRLYELLCFTAKAKREMGMVVTENVDKPV